MKHFVKEGKDCERYKLYHSRSEYIRNTATAQGLVDENSITRKERLSRPHTRASLPKA